MLTTHHFYATCFDIDVLGSTALGVSGETRPDGHIRASERGAA